MTLRGLETSGVMKDLTDDPDFIRDNDSLYVMPLRIVPFETPALRYGRLIKNAALRPAIEVFNSEDGGSGQILIEDIDPEFGQKHFGWSKNEVSPDLEILGKLARLTSYDVYSLRVLFRELQIPIASVKYLCLSDQKMVQLRKYMRIFTQPLMRRIFGDAVAEGDDSADFMTLLQDSDPAETLRRLEVLAEALNIPIQSIPTFLEDFADIYMSFSYYQEYLDDIVPRLVDMLGEIADLKNSFQMKQDLNLMNACNGLTRDLGDLTVGLTGRFESFHTNTKGAWNNISVERFSEVGAMVKAHHTTIGGVLCGLGIKLNAWRQRFPSRDSGGPQARAEFLHSSVLPGIKQLMALNERAPVLMGAGQASDRAA